MFPTHVGMNTPFTTKAIPKNISLRADKKIYF
jgi:hypothetical protein